MYSFKRTSLVISTCYAIVVSAPACYAWSQNSYENPIKPAKLEVQQEESEPELETGFFPKDSARTVFSDYANIVPQKDIEHWPRENKPLDLEKIRLEEEAKVKQEKADILAAALSQGKIDKQTQTDIAQANQAPKSAEEVLAKYGSPHEDAPVAAQENAPTPFKAAMAALEAGDKELSYAYVRQYVRHIKKVQDSISQVLGMMDAAQVREGNATDGYDLSKAPPEVRALYEKDIQESKKHLAVMNGVTQVPAELRAMLQKAEEEEQAKQNLITETTQKLSQKTMTASELQQELSGDDLRMYARRRYAGKTPVDPEGIVKIYYFFGSKDRGALPMAQVIEKMKSLYSADSRVEVIGFSIDNSTQAELDLFRKVSGVSIKLTDGSKIASSFGITSSPTTVVMTPNQAEALYEEGILKPEYVDELIRMVQGKPIGKGILY